MPRRIIVVAVLLTFASTACRTWTPVQGIPNPVPEPIRVELVTGEEFKLMGGRVEADTLVGRRLGGAERVRLPLDQIASVEVNQVSGERTGLLIIVGIPLALFGGFIVAVGLGWASVF